MAFGTGHHATTCLMAGLTADMGVAGRRGLDLGSGTGVLAILAVKCGAAHVDAVDTDEWAERNCRENAAANGVADRVDSLLGDIGRVAGRRYGFVLANINRNVLVACMPAMAEALVPGRPARVERLSGAGRAAGGREGYGSGAEAPRKPVCARDGRPCC